MLINGEYCCSQEAFQQQIFHFDISLTQFEIPLQFDDCIPDWCFTFSYTMARIENGERLKRKKERE